MNEEIQKYFKDNGYVIIRDFLPEDIVNISYEYCKLKVNRQSEKHRLNLNNYMQPWDGHWGDVQIPGSYNLYGDPYFDSILKLSTQSISDFTGLQLTPEYSYWRFYQPNDILEKHIDRPSCEISTTLCIGYDTSNKENYIWPICITDREGKNQEIILKPGDMLIYKGCELAHWRDKFLGLCHAQVFLHFKDINGPYFDKDKLYDDRFSLGLPRKFQLFTK